MGTDLSSSGFDDDNFNEPSGESDGLGSLAQAARSKSLKSARNILLIIGILTLLGNGGVGYFAISRLDTNIQKEVDSLKQQGHTIDEVALAEHREQAMRLLVLTIGFGCAIGCVFILLGLFVKKFPIPMTITGLVLYLGSIGANLYLDPTSLRGWPIKLLIIAALFKAIQAAIAYEKEEKSNESAPAASILE